MPRQRITTYAFIERSNAIHGGKYIYDKTIYEKADEKVIITCREHGDFLQTPNTHYKGSGCPECAVTRMHDYFISKAERFEKIFIEKAHKIHGSKYDYSKAIYKNAHDKIIIICPEHGEFKQEPNQHLAGSGCPVCAGCGKGNKDRFLKDAKRVHGDKYDYSKVVYTNNKTNVIIICSIHGEFLQAPSNHLMGMDCFRCAKSIFDTPSFIEKAMGVHGDRYIYDEVNYTGHKNKVIIICRIHGRFNQSASNHVNGGGCPSCSHLISRPETEWIQSLNNPNIIIHHHIKGKVKGKYYNVDGYDPTTNTIYEYYGSFWHGNPEFFARDAINKANGQTYGELYDETMQRERELISLGYNIVVKWSPKGG